MEGYCLVFRLSLRNTKNSRPCTLCMFNFHSMSFSWKNCQSIFIKVDNLFLKCLFVGQKEYMFGQCGLSQRIALYEQMDTVSVGFLFSNNKGKLNA